MATCQALREEVVRLLQLAADQPGNAEFVGYEAREGFVPCPQWLVGEIAVVQQQAIEEKDTERHGLAQRRDVELATEAPHRLLERQRCAVLAQRNGLTVEDELLRWK